MARERLTSLLSESGIASSSLSDGRGKVRELRPVRTVEERVGSEVVAGLVGVDILFN